MTGGHYQIDGIAKIRHDSCNYLTSRNEIRLLFAQTSLTGIGELN